MGATLAAEGVQADVIHANNVIAHIPDVNGVFAGIKAVLKPDGVAVIEAPYVRELVERCAFDTVYHEHFFYHAATPFQALVARQGELARGAFELSINLPFAPSRASASASA